VCKIRRLFSRSWGRSSQAAGGASCSRVGARGGTSKNSGRKERVQREELAQVTRPRDSRASDCFRRRRFRAQTSLWEEVLGTQRTGGTREAAHRTREALYRGPRVR